MTPLSLPVKIAYIKNMDIIYDDHKKNKATRILDQLSMLYPEAGTRLVFSSIFELLVAVVLSAQSTDEQVNRVTANLFKVADTPSKMASLELAELEDLIRGVGIYRNKARHLKDMVMMLVERYAGRVPDSFEELMKLPGVGRKSANVVMAVGFNSPGLGVDTHVQRVAYRTGLVSGKRNETSELELKKQIPPERWGEAHHLLIYHGRNTCKSRKPDCRNCVLEDDCSKRMD
ncbi:MAG: endonuclease III [Deltaproteobacteria bacterium]